MPPYARKRTVRLIGQTIAGHIQQLLRWQYTERRAKQNILQIFQWILAGHLKDEEQVQIIHVILKDQMRTLKLDAGLRPEFVDKVFKPLLEETSLRHFLDRLKTKSSPTRETSPSNFLGTLTHDRQGRAITLLDYLLNEEQIRKGTWEDFFAGDLTFAHAIPFLKSAA